MAAAAVLIGTAACGGGAGSAPSPGRALSPSPSERAATPNLLFAVLEALPGQNADTVAIAGLDGYARAKAHFAPRAGLYVPDAAVVRMPEAQVVGGAVYFVDPSGVVRELTNGNTTREVAAFPLAATQQEISFAVSPDGTEIIAAVLTLPAVGPSPSPGGAPWPPLIGPWKLDILLATAGRGARNLHEWSASAEPGQPGGFSNIVILAWTAAGPAAVVGSNVATQNAAFAGQRIFGGHFALVDPLTGLPGPSLGACQSGLGGPWSAAADGSRICALYNDDASATITVTTPGAQDWRVQVPGATQMVGDFVLSADGSRLAMDGKVVGRDGSALPLPAGFQPEGWLDASTLIGYENRPAGQFQEPWMYYVWLPRSTEAVDLGFAGHFVGVTAAA